MSLYSSTSTTLPVSAGSSRRLFRALWLVAVTCLVLFAAADRALAQPATDVELPGLRAGRGEHLVLPPVNRTQLRLADEQRAARGVVPHYAVGQEAAVTPWDRGVWELLRGDLARWRLRITAADALSLNLAFDSYRMPPGGSLTVTSTDGRFRIGPFTERDHDEHGQLWTPPIPAADLVVEVVLPVERLDQLELRLATVYYGYAGFGAPPPLSGDCHRDVACSEAAGWSDQARAVALISVAGVRFCTGYLINNTALDGRPFFVTADHCGITASNAPSVVVMWGHERSVCGATPLGPASDAGRYLRHFQTGAVLRAAWQPTDTLLLELDDPPPAAAAVYYAGWDRTAADPERSVVIHHPNTDFKRISFDFDRATTTWHLADQIAERGTHLRIGGWDLGSTEGGSSGAPLFNRDRRVVGQLHGGYAACGDRRPDWFGRLSSSWTGGGRPGTRLSDWLDPIHSDATVLDGADGTALLP